MKPAEKSLKGLKGHCEAKARRREKERKQLKAAAKAARERARDPDFEELGVEAILASKCPLQCLCRMALSLKSPRRTQRLAFRSH